MRSEAPRRQVLVTGVFGRVGPTLVEDFRARYELRTYDLRPDARNPAHFSGDLQLIETLRAAMRGCDVLVHLAATSDEAPFVEELVPNNVVGVYNALEAARLEGVKRVVFASSCQTMGAYPRSQSVETSDIARPHTLYGATKVLAEAMGRFYHDQYGLEFIALRLGAFGPYGSDEENRDRIARKGRAHGNLWLSPRDCAALFRLAIEKAGVGYAVVNGTSLAPQPILSLESAREILGYEPIDSALSGAAR